MEKIIEKARLLKDRLKWAALRGNHQTDINFKSADEIFEFLSGSREIDFVKSFNNISMLIHENAKEKILIRHRNLQT